ncbi:MAG: glucose-1-phosphate cytidylyltransferase [Bdellovibrionaceae bacterium]|jgi:glucose-1-phosphate cytidylyltransferase|nr:glucose-1-phosphate cytidylyltransferase [Pseudobdellovibrionaceae bacterium]
MKAVILAGGYGTRISEESDVKPKPMIDIGGKPILWHIMKIYAHHGVKDFVILLGYKGYVIKEYFANYFLHNSHVTIGTKNQKLQVHDNFSEDWNITLVETGLETMTGGRIKRAAEFIGNEPFYLTYGDGVANVDLHALAEYHKKNKRKVTLTAIQPDGRFGILDLAQDNSIHKFLEKPKTDWINGGFFVCDPSIMSYIDGDSCVFERSPLERLAQENQLIAYKHPGFWSCMDTLRDKNHLNELWAKKEAPWKVWK